MIAGPARFPDTQTSRPTFPVDISHTDGGGRAGWGCSSKPLRRVRADRAQDRQPRLQYFTALFVDWPCPAASVQEIAYETVGREGAARVSHCPVLCRTKCLCVGKRRLTRAREGRMPSLRGHILAKHKRALAKATGPWGRGHLALARAARRAWPDSFRTDAPCGALRGQDALAPKARHHRRAHAQSAMCEIAPSCVRPNVRVSGSKCHWTEFRPVGVWLYAS